MPEKEGQKKQNGNKGNALITAGCKAYGIDPAYVLGSRIDPETGEAVIVTNGGKKVRYASGQKDIEPLSEVEVTGINPKAKKRKPIAGKVKMPVEDKAEGGPDE